MAASRRQFILTVAAGAAACATTSTPAAPVATPASAPATAPAPASAPASAPAPNPSADALLAVVQARHGDKLDAAALANLRKGLAQIVAMSATLRAFRLPNDAEPSGGLIGNPGRVS